jgi:hypothetical protein
MFDEMDLDMNILGVASLIGIIVIFFLFADPFKTGMNTIPLIARVVIAVAVIPLCYKVIEFKTR